METKVEYELVGVDRKKGKTGKTDFEVEVELRTSFQAGDKLKFTIETGIPYVDGSWFKKLLEKVGL